MPENLKFDAGLYGQTFKISGNSVHVWNGIQTFWTTNLKTSVCIDVVGLYGYRCHT